MICEYCGQELVKVGRDFHHGVDVFRCGCCADVPKDAEEIIKAKTAGNNGLASKKWTAQLEEIRKLLETQTGENNCQE